MYLKPGHFDLFYPTTAVFGKDHSECLPYECRMSHLTYESRVEAVLCLEMDGETIELKRQIGPIPMMVGSDKCHLTKYKNRKTMQQMHEDDRESGGYFIINGNERVIRLLIAPKRHVPLLLERESFRKCGPMFTRFGCVMRSVREDGTGASLQQLYLNDGTIMIRIWISRRGYFLPLAVVLRACSDRATDKEIYDRVRGDADDKDVFVLERLMALLDQGREKGLVDHLSCLRLLGAEFRLALPWLSREKTDEEVGRYFLDRFILVHLKDGHEKMLMLTHMARRLFALVRGEVKPDNLDALSNQEVWTSGMIYGMALKERLWQMMESLSKGITSLFYRSPNADMDAVRKRFASTLLPLGPQLRSFLATGNFVAKFCTDLQQETGFVIMAEKLNHLRYTAHFRCVHRGAFFQDMKTSTVRKLMPESWGFMCPVHTPDGAPCGLVNHMSAECKVVDGSWNPAVHHDKLVRLLESKGVVLASKPPPRSRGFCVLLDGHFIGQIPDEYAQELVDELRMLKMTGSNPDVLPSLEVVFAPRNCIGYPGITLSSGQGRLIRQVKSLKHNMLEWIGPAEQLFLDIAVTQDRVTSATQYIEISPNSMLSVIARLTPFCDFNQSPRNMYQCQMAKQTMGVATSRFPFRSDNKMFRITYGQQPVVRTQAHRKYAMDEFPNGLNAVVAVLAYTGYDMEDAMIINKASHDRGIASASVYYSQLIELKSEAEKTGYGPQDLYFDNGPLNRSIQKVPYIDEDGLPMVGTKLQNGDVLCIYYNRRTNTHVTIRNKKQDPVVVDVVIPVTQIKVDETLYTTTVLIKLREPRTAVIGDKFSSRHGQKGTLSRLWPQEDMPFTDSGIVPDILINPHAFPSRMTIGMLLESMAGKAGAVHGLDQDGTAFQFSENERAVDFFGKQLLDAGFQYYGSESMYSGIYGTELQVDIFMGVVFYQRLRHMVGDKFQARSEGPINQLTRQPVGGRKHQGGIRFGEMERDSLLAHGASMMINDRLMGSSDYSHAYACRMCGSILSPYLKKGSPICKTCDTGQHVSVIAIPFVFRYLACEFAAFGIRCDLNIREIK